MTPYQMIEAYKAEKGIESDNAAAKDLGLTRQAINAVKKGGGFGIETAWKISETVGLDLAEVIATCELARAERSEKEELAAVWKQRLQRVSHSPLTAFFAIALAGAGKLAAQLCILCQIDGGRERLAKSPF